MRLLSLLGWWLSGRVLPSVLGSILGRFITAPLSLSLGFSVREPAMTRSMHRKYIPHRLNTCRVKTRRFTPTLDGNLVIHVVKFIPVRLYLWILWCPPTAAPHLRRYWAISQLKANQSRFHRRKPRTVGPNRITRHSLRGTVGFSSDKQSGVSRPIDLLLRDGLHEQTILVDVAKNLSYLIQLASTS